MRALTGFDRVMVYRFAEDGSGEVVAEAVKSGIGRFHGLRYPASDIPQQERELYRRSWLRMISDVNAEPVPVVPARDASGQILDLSLSVLRSVSRIHVEYLKNMGVAASLSISIIVEGSCGACSPAITTRPTAPASKPARWPSCSPRCSPCGWRAGSVRPWSSSSAARATFPISCSAPVASDETLLKDPDWLGDILTHAISADGVGVWIGGNYAFSGSTPNIEDFRRIVRALNGTAAGKVYGTDHIGGLVKGGEKFASAAAGLLAIPISRTPRDYVVLFRRELVHSVRWAGDPHKPIEYGPNGPRLTPRESFAEWKETVEGKSKPFTVSEKRVAETLRATLIEVVLRLADEASAERQAATARQELLIAELNHRVRNILGVIRGLIRQSQPTGDDLGEFVKVVDGRIHALARAHNQITDDHWGPAPLQALIDAEAAAFVEDPDRIVYKGDPVMLNPQAYSTMALVLHELVTNSTKYGALSPAGGHVTIAWHRNEGDDLVLEWSETGGPPVKPPTRKGFGTTIIDRSVPYDLGGSAHIDYDPAGVHAKFCIPSRHVSAPASLVTPVIKYPRASAGHPQPTPSTVLKGQDVLLVEDSLIIALDAEDIIGRLGADSTSTAATVEAALDTIDAHKPTVAILDINLGDRNSFPIADRLMELKVPFLFATGYGEQAHLPEDHKDRPVVQKPYTLENVARALDGLLKP